MAKVAKKKSKTPTIDKMAKQAKKSSRKKTTSVKKAVAAKKPTKLSKLPAKQLAKMLTDAGLSAKGGTRAEREERLMRAMRKPAALGDKDNVTGGRTKGKSSTTPKEKKPTKKGRSASRSIDNHTISLLKCVSRSSFDKTVDAIKNDKTLTSADIKAIAVKYNGGGKAPKTKQAALAMIGTRRAEIVRSAKNLHTAGEVRIL